MAEDTPADVIFEMVEGADTKPSEDQEETVIDNREKGHEIDKNVDNIDAEVAEAEHIDGEHIDGEHVDGEQTDTEVAETLQGEGEDLIGEGLEGEQATEEGEEKKEAVGGYDEMVVEEEAYVEEPPPDPAAPYDLSDSKELLREPFVLRPDQVVEVEQLWELYQDYNPAYTDIDNYITEKELIYMLKALMLMTYTPEQLEELVAFCVRPPHPEGHINYEQFLKMVTIRQRDVVIEEELRAALQLLDPEKTGSMDREYFKETLLKTGHKMTQKQVDFLIKEVDISNDGTIGIDDVVGTMCIDLNKDDIIMLRQAVYPQGTAPVEDEF